MADPRTADLSDAARREWTILVYAGADDNGVTINLTDFPAWLAGVDIRPGVNFVFEIAEPDRTVRARAVKGKDGTVAVDVISTSPRIDSGKPASVTDFIDWATSTYPSRHTALVLKDHGAGLDQPPGYGGYTASPAAKELLENRFTVHPREAVLDGKSGRYLSNLDVRDAVQRSKLGHVDVLAFDACYMSWLEVMYELRDVADFVVASPNPVLLNGAFPYAAVMKDLSTTPEMSARQVASRMATGNPDAGLIAVAEVWVKHLADALDKLGVVLLKSAGNDDAVLERLRAWRNAFGQGDMTDLEVAMATLKDYLPDAAPFADAVNGAFAEARIAKGSQPVLNVGKTKETLGGLWLFFPSPPESRLWGMYGSLSFARTNFWTTFLLKLAWPTLIQPNG